MSMTNQIFRNNDTGAEVYILDYKGNFYILSNGSQITQEAFLSKYTPVTVPITSMQQENVEIKTSKIEPANIMQELAQIKKGQNKIMENNNPGTGSDVIDPTAFLYSSNPSYNNLLNKVSSIDSSKVPDIPQSQDLTTVKITNPDGNIELPSDGLSLEEKKAALIREHNKTAAAQGKPMIGAEQYKQIDENDDAAIQQFIGKKDNRTGEIIDPETGLSELQTRKRKVAIDTTGQDPFADRVAEWQKKHKIGNIAVKSNEVVEQFNNNIPNNFNSVGSVSNSSIDVMDMILSSFEENFPLTVKLNINKKIIDPTFFKLISKNLKGDAVEHYTNQILSDMLSDAEGLHDEIYKQVKAVLKVNKSKTEISSGKVSKKEKKHDNINKVVKETENNIAKSKEEIVKDVISNSETEIKEVTKVKRGPKSKKEFKTDDKSSQTIS